jgi:hypothetical protein
MLGQINGRIVFPMSEPPDFIPNASDVILIFNQSNELWFVHVKQGNHERFYILDSFDFSICQ